MSREVNPAKCPLCGGPNRCALAADPSATECWCDSETFPRELFEYLPKEAIRKACICQTCLENYQEGKTLPNTAG